MSNFAIFNYSICLKKFVPLQASQSMHPLSKVLLYSVQIGLVRYVDRVLPDSVFQNIAKFFVRNSHDFVEWTRAIQSEHETLMNHSTTCEFLSCRAARK